MLGPALLSRMERYRRFKLWHRTDGLPHHFSSVGQDLPNVTLGSLTEYSEHCRLITGISNRSVPEYGGKAGSVNL